MKEVQKTKFSSLQERDDRSTWLVCRTPHGPESSNNYVNYEVHQVFPGEIWSEEVDSVDGSHVTVFKKDGHTLNTAGEPCGEFKSVGEARIHASRLEDILKIMES